ncbi:calcium-activated chloride channel regulator 4-like [Octodon degus]|uniref:Calcium-activated chloride channel regulator 4-like n=1 Tax=Octodon degus TaxID=10160 RepID=A0A6P3FK61_OCTDE|nr:calcium-activated chloride channel regulator 4-like [Octodon degus]
MGSLRALASLLVLHLLQGSNASLVQLKDNGYEDVIIAIDPDVPEDAEIIEQIKVMVTTASTYLFEATEKRFFFKNVSILIPETWGGNSQYKRPKYESYQHADVIIAPPTLQGRDEPYTRQFTECGEKAQYIHFTPDVVLGKKQDEYGATGRLLVHEWAHLRWGVFDEYNEDEPFYGAKSKKIEATRCSAGISGTNSIYTCQGGSCVTRRCRIDSTTKLYEKNCQFFPDKDQTEKASIMFMQSINSVVEFCNEKNHNQEAPSLQNLKCNYRSTWEVIRESEDYKNTTVMEETPPAPTFSLLRISDRIVCLVLDKSGSMGNDNRLNRMNQAAKHFLLQTVENGSWVGMVQFDSVASITSELIQIRNNSERDTLLKNLPTVALGGTSICAGIRTAFQVITNKNFDLDGSEIVLLTDGEDNTASSCIGEVRESGAIIHFIALGPTADAAVKEMATITGGKAYYSSDKAQNNGLIDAFAALMSENAALSQKSLQLESKGLALSADTWMNGTVVIDSTVGKDTFFLITWTAQTPNFSLLDPSGALIETFTQDSDSRMAYVTIPGNAQVGMWTYNLQAKADSEILTMTVTSRAANSSVPPITVSAKMNKDTNTFPSPMIVYAEVQQGYVPILGVSVTAIIESSSGNTHNLDLLDNGAGADAFKDDGVYSRYFTSFTEDGRYSLKVRVNGGENSTRRSSPLNRAAFVPGWVENGEIKGNPRPETNETTQTFGESFSRTASGGAFVLSGFQAQSGDMYPPSQITDLDGTFDSDNITLRWTAPGEDLDSGKAQQYIIRINESMLDLRDHFDDSLQIDATDLVPQEANSKEIFTFKPENISENATHIFIAIQSIDQSDLKSQVSNIAQIALFTPENENENETQSTPTETTTTTNTTTTTIITTPDGGYSPGVNSFAMVLSVVGSVAIVNIVVSLFVS